MKWRIALAFVSVFSNACHSAQSEPPSVSEGLTVIEGATVIDATFNAPIEDAVLVLEGAWIRHIGKRGSFKVPTQAQKIDARGKTIMPGMFDLHTHVAIAEKTEMNADYYTDENIQRDANWALHYGVMHVVSLGFDRDLMFQLREAQRSGRREGARLYTAGAGFSPKGGYRPLVPLGNTSDSQWINRPSTPDEVRQLVQKEAARRVDLIKIWIRDGQPPNFSPAMYGTIIEEAHRHDLKAMVHVTTLKDAKDVLRRGADGLAHVVLDKEVDDEFLRLAKEKGVTQTATLAAVWSVLAYADNKATFLEDPGLDELLPEDFLRLLRSPAFRDYPFRRPGPDSGLERRRQDYRVALKNVGRIAAAGIAVVTGTDAGPSARFIGLWNHLEMEQLVKAGLTPMQAIQAATINGAMFLGVDKRYGTLERGKAADFLVLTGNPLSDITNTRKIDAVWMNGKPIDRHALAQQGRHLSMTSREIERN